MKILLLLLALVPSAFAQSYHWQTNITQVRCVSYHYYGVRQDGAIIAIGQVEDHNAQAFESGSFDPQFSFVLRSEKPIQPVTVAQPKRERDVRTMLPPPLPEHFYVNPHPQTNYFPPLPNGLTIK